MGKGTDLERRWAERAAERQAAIARGERPPGYNPRPELRLRADTPSVGLYDADAAEVVSNLTPNEYSVALRDADGTVKAMAVPLDRYIELVSGTIAGDYHAHAEVLPEPSHPGSDRPRLQAKPSSLEAMHVEQRGVFPHVLWLATDQRRADVIAACVAGLPEAERGLFRVALFEQAVGVMGGQSDAENPSVPVARI